MTKKLSESQKIQPKFSTRQTGSRILAMRYPAYVIWPRSFLEAAAGAQQIPSADNSAGNASKPSGAFAAPHLIPRSVELKDLKYREILEHIDLSWGITEVWWQVIRKRLQWKQAKDTKDTPGHDHNEPNDDDLQLLFDRIVGAFDWHEWIPPNAQLEITAECQRSRLRNAKRVRNCVRSAIEKFDRAQSQASTIVFSSAAHSSAELATAAARPPLSIKTSVFRDTLTLYLPLGFDKWFHRRYKSGLSHPASLREDYAQSIIGLLAKWLGCEPPQLPNRLYAPFAGSGTFVFEYFTMRWQLGHALVAKDEAFLASPGAPKLSLENLRKRAQARALSAASQSNLVALAAEIEPNYCDSISKTFKSFQELLPEAAREKLSCHVLNQDFFQIDAAQLRNGLENNGPSSRAPEPVCVLLNPPFGERLTGHYTPRLFEQIGEYLAGLAAELKYCAAVICPSDVAALSLTQPLTRSSLQCAETPFSYGSLDARIVFIRTY
jgi:23S rRNA G2445 N2-methylase RlmL